MEAWLKLVLRRAKPSVKKTRPPTEGVYLIFATTFVECLHIGHSKVRNSCPGVSGTMRASSTCVPHFEHSGRIVSGCKRFMSHAPNIRREHYRTLSHRRLGKSHSRCNRTNSESFNRRFLGLGLLVFLERPLWVISGHGGMRSSLHPAGGPD
jgi:hypothetical protein